MAERASIGEPHSPRGQARLFNLLGIARTTLGDLGGAAAFRAGAVGRVGVGDGGAARDLERQPQEVHLRLGDDLAAARHQGICLELARAGASRC